MGAAGIALWLAAHSWWELMMAAICTVLAVVGFYGMIAPLTGLPAPWLRRIEPQRATDIIFPYLRDAGIRQEKIDTLTALLTEGTRVLDQLNAHGSNWADIHLVPQWTQGADDNLRRDFGAPYDTLARNHSHGNAPSHLRSRDQKLWEEADKRRGQITDMLKELSPLSH